MQQKKTALRGQMKKIREELHSQDNESARKVAARLLMLPELAVEVQRGIKAENVEPHIVAGYMPIQTELNGHYILKAMSAIHCRIALPVMTGEGASLAFREWDMVTDLQDGPFGTREPDGTMPEIWPNIILLPMLSFDETGNRLGYGGGYYDRTLEILRKKRHSFTAIGIAYEGQKYDEVPVGPNDQPLDIIVTDERVYRL